MSLIQRISDLATSVGRRSKRVNSRLGLIANGDGVLGTTENWTGVTSFVSTDAYSGYGSFEVQTRYGLVHETEFLPVNPNDIYEASFALRTSYKPVAGTNLFYYMILPYDIETLQIDAWHHLIKPNTRVTLAAALNIGDTTITVSDASSFSNAADWYFRNLSLPYTNGLGQSYGDYSYSRNIALGAYNVGGITGNVITLKAPWGTLYNRGDGANVQGAGTYPIGTAIWNSQAGGSFPYPIANRELVGMTWQRFYTRFGGTNTSGLESNNLLPAGTAKIRIGFLMNFGTVDTYTRISAVSLNWKTSTITTAILGQNQSLKFAAYTTSLTAGMYQITIANEVALFGLTGAGLVFYTGSTVFTNGGLAEPVTGNVRVWVDANNDINLKHTYAAHYKASIEQL